MNATVLLESFVLGTEHNGIRMSTDEFDAITEYDELYNYELVHGVVIVNPIPSQEERDPNEELGHWLRNYRDNRPEGSVLDSTLSEEYVRTTDSRRRADRVVWVGLGRQPDPVVDVPTILVEFVSKGRRNWQRDYIEKRDEYLDLGVKEYWVIDRFERRMTVFKKLAEQTAETTVQEIEVYQTELLPGFALPLARLLAVADRWSSK
jgi:Uma2 family endonuclease